MIYIIFFFFNFLTFWIIFWYVRLPICNLTLKISLHIEIMSAAMGGHTFTCFAWLDKVDPERMCDGTVHCVTADLSPPGSLLPCHVHHTVPSCTLTPCRCSVFDIQLLLHTQLTAPFSHFHFPYRPPFVLKCNHHIQCSISKTMGTETANFRENTK